MAEATSEYLNRVPRTRADAEFYSCFQKMRDLLRDFTNDEDIGCYTDRETWDKMRSIVREAERF